MKSHAHTRAAFTAYKPQGPEATSGPSHRAIPRAFAVCLLALAPLWSATSPALTITKAVAEPESVAANTAAPIQVRFRLDEPARISLNLYDGRDLLIRRIQAPQDPSAQLPAGDHAIPWDLRDQAGRPVPPEAYRWTLTATTADRRSVEYDLTDVTADGDLAVAELRWDAGAGVIRYRLSAPGRVNIRIGLDNNGPLLRTLLDWVVRDAGDHAEPWDGRDASGVLNLAEHPRLAIAWDGFGLSDNSVLVGPPRDQVQVIEDITWGEERRTVKRQDKKRMHFHRQQPMEERADYQIHLTLPDGLPRDAEGLPIVSGVVPVRLDVPDSERERVLARRFEPVFFVDGIFAFENEVGFLPMTWRWDTVGTNPGIHYVTANLRGYEGNFGIATLKVRVQPQAETEEQTRP